MGCNVMGWSGIGYLNASRESSADALKEQSLPPYPARHAHSALQISMTVQEAMWLPEGSL